MDIFHSPITLAHHFWKEILKPGDHVLDATCGNGKDTEVLANLVLKQTPYGSVTGLDIQETAIQTTRERLTASLSYEEMGRVHLMCRSHSNLIQDFQSQKLKLIVYNLGYLPGGDKSITTMSSSSLNSIKGTLELLSQEGYLSITCYPGHAEGKKETDEIASLFESLSPKQWTICQSNWPNRHLSPILFIIRKS